MAITIYKNMYHVGWDTTGVGVVRSTGGGVGTPTDLSNYYTIEQLVGPGLSIVDFANIVNIEHNLLPGLQGGLEYSDSAPPDSDDSSGVPDVISEYYHLDFVNYTRIINQNFIDSLVEESDSIVHLDGDVFDPGINYYYGTDGTGTKGWYNLFASDNLWEADSIGVLSPIDDQGVKIGSIFINEQTLMADPEGDLILRPGDYDSTYTLGAKIILGGPGSSNGSVTLEASDDAGNTNLSIIASGAIYLSNGGVSSAVGVFPTELLLISPYKILVGGNLDKNSGGVITAFNGMGSSGHDLYLQGGDNTLGSYDGGNVYIYGGEAFDSLGVSGEVYISDGSSGNLQPKTTETNVVFYDPTTGKLSYGAGSGGESLWIELSDGYLSPVGNQGVIISDGDGSMQVTSMGWVTFSGDARFRKSIQIPISALAIGDGSPNIYWFSTITFGYAYTIADNSAFSFVTPLDYSLDTDIYIRVYWCVNDALVTDQQVQWVGSFTCCPVDGSEQIDDTTGGSTYSGDIPIPVLARSVVYTDLQIPLNYIAPGDLINVELWRETVSGSDPSAEPVILNVVVWYLADRLGDPL